MNSRVPVFWFDGRMPMIELVDGPEGVVLPVKARPGTSKNAILGEHAGALKVAVTAAPEKGKANQAIVKLLAKELGLRKADIHLVRGPTSSEKAFRIIGIDRAALAHRLEELTHR